MRVASDLPHPPPPVNQDSTPSPAATPKRASRPPDLAPFLVDHPKAEDTDLHTIESVRRGDAEALNTLYNRVFGKQRPLEQFFWKFWANPSGAPIGFYARSRADGSALSAAVAQRRKFRAQGRDQEAALLCEVCSDPSARGGGRVLRGAMYSLGRSLYTEHGIRCIYGGQISDALIAVGKRWFAFQTVFVLKTLELRLAIAPALHARLGAAGTMLGRILDPLLRLAWRRAGSIACEEVADFGPEFDALWVRYRDNYGICFARDASSLRWRWLENPTPGHRILLARQAGGVPVGYIVWREWRSGVHKIATVLDLWTGGDEAVITALLDAARRAAARSGCVFLRFAVREASVEQRAMESLGARVSPFEKPDEIITSPLQHLQRDDTDDDWEFWRLMLDGGNWYYTQGDSDYND